MGFQVFFNTGVELSKLSLYKEKHKLITADVLPNFSEDLLNLIHAKVV